jgi:hypothetical protein
MKKVQQKGSTTYNEVSDELVHELQEVTSTGKKLSVCGFDSMFFVFFCKEGSNLVSFRIFEGECMML